MDTSAMIRDTSGRFIGWGIFLTLISMLLLFYSLTILMIATPAKFVVLLVVASSVLFIHSVITGISIMQSLARESTGEEADEVHTLHRDARQQLMLQMRTFKIAFFFLILFVLAITIFWFMLSRGMFFSAHPTT